MATPQHELLLRLPSLAKAAATSVVGLRIPYASCFARRVELPAAAANDFERMLALDFERVTPFKAKDVYLTHFIEQGPAEQGKVWVRQLVVKRNAVNGLKAEVEALGLTVGSIDCWNEDGTAALPVNFLTEDASNKPLGSASWPVSKLLAGCAAALAVTAAYILVDKYDTALQDLQAQTARQKAKVQAVREALGRSQSAYAEFANLNRLRRDYVSRVSAIEELTRLMPDTAWVTDLKIEGSNVDISGLANKAATLIPLLERSAMFVDATPTAALTFDQREDKDRFSVRVHIRSGESATATKPQGSGR